MLMKIWRKRNNREDYSQILEKLENELGIKLDILISHIEYTHVEKGEIIEFQMKNYGPPLIPFIEEICQCGWNITVICESPLMTKMLW